MSFSDLDVPDYPAQVGFEVLTCLTNGSPSTSIALLLSLLGCKTIQVIRSVWAVVAGTPPPPEHEALVTRTLLQAVRWTITETVPGSATHADRYSLLEGLCTNNRWRACLDNADDALAFVGLLVDFNDSMHTHPLLPGGGARRVIGLSLRLRVTPPLCTVLNEWLMPAHLFEVFPRNKALASALLVDAWGDINIGISALDSTAMRALLLDEGAPFRTGLLPFRTSDPIDLPPLVLDSSCTI
jgi:hypothetical protein